MLEAEEDTESHGKKSVLKAFLDLLFSSTRRLKTESNNISTVIARQIHNVLGNLNETQLVKALNVAMSVFDDMKFPTKLFF